MTVVSSLEHGFGQRSVSSSSLLSGTTEVTYLAAPRLNRMDTRAEDHSAGLYLRR